MKAGISARLTATVQAHEVKERKTKNPFKDPDGDHEAAQYKECLSSRYVTSGVTFQIRGECVMALVADQSPSLVRR